MTINYDLKTIGFGGLVFLYDEKICGIRMFCLLDSQIMELKCCLYLIYSAWSSALWECRWMRKQKGLSQKEFVHRMCACRTIFGCYDTQTSFSYVFIFFPFFPFFTSVGIEFVKLLVMIFLIRNEIRVRSWAWRSSRGPWVPLDERFITSILRCLKGKNTLQMIFSYG